MTTMRYAILEGQADKLEAVRRYMPGNYVADVDGDDIKIHGTDNAGWTLKDYVIPRLQSGLFFPREIFPHSPSKAATIIADADAAYDREDQEWFNALPTDSLTLLWGIACVNGASWDDEVFDALAAREWFD